MRLARTRLVILFSLVLAFVATSAVQGQDLDPLGTKNKAKLIGTWEVTSAKGALPKGTLVQFIKDGKMKVTFRDATTTAVVEVQYTVSASTIRTTYKDEAGKETKETLKIKKLDDKELVISNKDGKDDELKKNK